MSPNPSQNPSRSEKFATSRRMPLRKTRRGFLQTGGAGVVGLASGGASAAQAATRSKLKVRSSKARAGASTIRNNQIWINGAVTNLPYVLKKNDVISCYKPAGGGGGDDDVPTEVETFDVVDENNNPVIEYDNPDENPSDPDNDTLVVDETVVEDFQENYDPDDGGANSDPDPPYTVDIPLEDDSVGTIGING